MLKQPRLALAHKKLGSNKLVLGFAALAATAVISVTGVAAAQTMGSGYGGNTSNNNINVNVGGHNNVVTIILNIFR